MDRGDITGLVLLDLRKAFDMVNHDILLQKRIIYRQTMSEDMRVTSGGTPGLHLEPLLFIIFMNDLPLEGENCNLDMNADDSTLEASAKTVDQLEHKLASDMVKVEHWCFQNGAKYLKKTRLC